MNREQVKSVYSINVTQETIHGKLFWPATNDVLYHSPNTFKIAVQHWDYSRNLCKKKHIHFLLILIWAIWCVRGTAVLKRASVGSVVQSMIAIIYALDSFNDKIVMMEFRSSTYFRFSFFCEVVIINNKATPGRKTHTHTHILII